MDSLSRAATLLCIFMLFGCASSRKELSSQYDYVPLDQIQITDRFQVVDVTKSNLVKEIQKCVPQFSLRPVSRIVKDFPSKDLITITHDKSKNYFILMRATAACIHRSSNGFPIFAGEALYKTVDPGGPQKEVIDGWYREIALLIAKNGSAKVGYLFNDGAACIANYSVGNKKSGPLELSYSAVYQKKGTLESELLDVKFSHPLLTSYSIIGHGAASVHEKDYPLMHRFMLNFDEIKR